MVNLKKNGKVITVPESMASRYERAGWLRSIPTAKKTHAAQPAGSDMEKTMAEELETTPIKDWSADDVKFYAEYRKIDTSAAKTVKEAKEIVLRYLKKG